jgi:hypothetical protein
MEECRDKTIDAYNEFVNGLKHKNTLGTRLSLTIFDSESIDLVYDQIRIGDVPRLTRKTFVPRGGTPLLDAVGHAVAAVDKVNLLPDERVVLSILTDGLENASKEYTAEAVRKLLTDRQERCNWLVQYLGANQDAWEAGRVIGVHMRHAMAYDSEAVQPAMRAMSASIGRYASAEKTKARVAASFTPSERSSARGKKPKA